jgi:Rhodanese-like domain.
MEGTKPSGDVIEMVRNDKDVILVDVRTPEEHRQKRIPGSILLPDYELKSRAEEVLPDKDAKIVVYCRSGRRSAEAAKVLKEMGYKNVYDLGGIIDSPYETESGE